VAQAAQNMETISSVLTRPVGRKISRTVYITALIIVLSFYGYLFITGQSPASTVGPILPLRPGVPVFDKMIYGGFGELQFDKPMAVTAAHGRIYISDTNNSRIQVFDNNGGFLFTFGEKGKSQGQFLYPYGIAGDRNNNIYVSELYLSRIHVYDIDGIYQRDFATGLVNQGVIKSPGDITIVDNQMYLSDISQNRIFVIDLETEELVRQIGLEFDLMAPNGVAVDEAGNVFVTDTGRQRVVVFDPDGNPVRLINGTATGHGINSVLINPRGIGVDRSGNLYVVSNLSHTVFVFDREGKQIHSFGGQGDDNDKFMFPNGLHVDNGGRIFITDTSNQRVAVYRLAR
jgi:DNA-binding beta-propeller fold protein YncE